ERIVPVAEHEQIGPAVVVVVGPDRAGGGPGRVGHPRGHRHVGEGAIAVVVVQVAAAPVVGHIEVQAAVAVVVGPRGAGAAGRWALSGGRVVGHGQARIGGQVGEVGHEAGVLQVGGGSAHRARRGGLRGGGGNCHATAGD